ncbi:MAG TPA: murein biosynthesis integral membrane protein MurJ [Gemmatimonadaceae bacterium]|nr:murein biosynthesis integral membrane protein MurJ [Gemmatimonadaceae bacterium]
MSEAPAKSTGPARDAAPDRGGRHAFLVASGIFASRMAGLVRQRVFAHYFGLSAAADVFNAAFRIPNFLQNVFGEGVLSASFIPVYARTLTRGDEEEAGRLAGTIATILALVVAVVVLLGVLAAPALTGILAGGFEGEKRALTVRLVRILFPGAGLLVLSAWCLGILNSHRRFLLSYMAPVIWNVAMIATLIAGGRTIAGRSLETLAVWLAWGSVVGSALQFLVQLPAVLRLVPRLRLGLDVGASGTREVTRSFGPVFIGRGVSQISAFVDVVIASYLPTGAVTAISNAQTLYMLPISLFGMAVSAAELPAMSAIVGDDAAVAAVLRARVAAGLRRLVFFVVPSAVAFLALGDALATIVFRSGRFTADDARYVWAILAGSAVGLLAATMGRLYSSVLYARRDTRTPLHFAMVRVALTIALGYLFALQLPRLLGVSPRWGAMGLTASAGLAAWVELTLLRRAVHARIGAVEFSRRNLLLVYVAAITAAAVAWGESRLLPGAPRFAGSVLTVMIYCAVYLGMASLLRVAEARALVERVARRRAR